MKIACAGGRREEVLCSEGSLYVWGSSGFREGRTGESSVYMEVQ